MKICADKTKLLAYFTKDMETEVKYAKMINPITINGENVLVSEVIPFDKEAIRL